MSTDTPEKTEVVLSKPTPPRAFFVQGSEGIQNCLEAALGTNGIRAGALEDLRQRWDAQEADRQRLGMANVAIVQIAGSNVTVFGTKKADVLNGFGAPVEGLAFYDPNDHVYKGVTLRNTENGYAELIAYDFHRGIQQTGTREPFNDTILRPLYAFAQVQEWGTVSYNRHTYIGGPSPYIPPVRHGSSARRSSGGPEVTG